MEPTQKPMEDRPLQEALTGAQPIGLEEYNVTNEFRDGRPFLLCLVPQRICLLCTEL